MNKAEFTDKYNLSDKDFVVLCNKVHKMPQGAEGVRQFRIQKKSLSDCEKQYLSDLFLCISDGEYEWIMETYENLE